MPYPITHSFELDAGSAEPERILDHVQETAAKAGMDIVERGPARLVLSSSFMKARTGETLPMMTATRCEVLVQGLEGRRRVRIRARFGECVLLGGGFVVIPWLMALVVSPANAVRSLPVAGLSLLGIWLLLYLYGMLDVRIWPRVRIEEISGV